MEKLNRQLLLDIEKENKSENLNQEIINTINAIERTIEKFEYNNDERFYTYGRRNIVINEFNNNISEKNIKDAYGNLQDIIHCDDYISLNNRDEILANGLDYNKVQEDMDNYKKDGYICLQEKNIILEMISKLRNLLD